MKVNKINAFAIATGTAAAIVIASAAALVISQPAVATPQFAKDTGKACGDCHTSAKGGGPLTPLGEKFKANGNKMPASTTSLWQGPLPFSHRLRVSTAPTAD